MRHVGDSRSSGEGERSKTRPTSSAAHGAGPDPCCMLGQGGKHMRRRLVLFSPVLSLLSSFPVSCRVCRFSSLARLPFVVFVLCFRFRLLLFFSFSVPLVVVAAVSSGVHFQCRKQVESPGELPGRRFRELQIQIGQHVAMEAAHEAELPPRQHLICCCARAAGRPESWAAGKWIGCMDGWIGQAWLPCPDRVISPGRVLAGRTCQLPAAWRRCSSRVRCAIRLPALRLAPGPSLE